MNITYDQVVDWLESYGSAWETGDPDAAAALFTPDAEYFETPFDPPFTGSKGIGSYWAHGTGSQRDIHFAYRILNISDNHALAHWQAKFYRIANGNHVELDGIFFLEFAQNGRCITFREWWHRRETAP